MSYEFNRFRLLLSLALVGSTAALAGCGDTGADCGAGTTEVDGVCIPNDMVCAAGTVFDMTTLTCVPESTTTCGAGTILVDGMCVPESNIMCARGTVLMGSECVPDGSVICGRNTIFNAETGECDPDPSSICEGDLVFVEESGTCVDPDELLEGMADVRELGEINDPAFNEGAMPQVIDIADGDGSFYGCVEPMDFDEDGSIDADLDYFQVSVDGPTLLNVRADGIRGLSAAVAFFGQDDALLNAGWQRVIGSLSGTSANGQVFLPQAGDYFVAATDTRSLLLADVVAGGPDQCYFVQLSTEDLPTPTAIDEEMTTDTFGDPAFYTIADIARGDLVFTQLDELNADGDPEDNGNVSGTVVAVVNGVFVGQGAVSFDDFFGTYNPGIVAVPSLDVGDEVLIVVDSVLNVAADDVDYGIAAAKEDPQDMPTDGSGLTFTHDNDDDFGNWAFFTATAGDVVHLETDQPDGNSMTWGILAPNGLFFRPAGGSSVDDYIQIATDGIHYVQLFNNSVAQDDTYDVNFTQTDITPTELTLATAATGSLATEERGFFSIDLSTNDWVEIALSNFTGTITDGEIRSYDRTAFGSLDGALPALDVETTDGAIERILLGEGQNILLTVADDAVHDMDEGFDLTVSDLPYMDLGAVDSATPQGATDVALAADAFSRFVVQGTVAGEIVSITSSSAALDTVLETLDIPGGTVDATIDDGGATEDEVFSTGVGPDGLTVAFRVSDFDGDAGMFDISVTAAPPPYSVDAAALTFASVCGTGTVITFATSPDDEVTDAISLTTDGAFPFQFFGDTKTEFYVSTNGFMTFRAGAGPDSGYPNTLLGSDDSDAIAPYGSDLNMTTGQVCYERNVDLFTIEWDGPIFGGGANVQMQVILHTDDSIDFVYGPGHSAAVLGADFVGLWNDDASIQLPLAGAAADTSWTWTPTP